MTARTHMCPERRIMSITEWMERDRLFWKHLDLARRYGRVLFTFGGVRYWTKTGEEA